MGVCEVSMKESVMENALVVAVLGLLMLPISACRHDFSVRRTENQECIFKSQTASSGWREFLLQYDAQERVLYSFQPYCDSDTTTTVRKYDLTGGFKEEWVVDAELDIQFAPSAIVGDELYQADVRDWRDPITNNIRVVNFCDGRLVHGANNLTGVLPVCTSCQGVVPIGEGQLLLKLLDMKTNLPSLAIFDCQKKAIVSRLPLRKTKEGSSVWFWKNVYVPFWISVSPDRSLIALRDENGTMQVYDSSLHEIWRVALSDFPDIADNAVGYQTLKVDWVDNDNVMLWSGDGGYWRLYNARTHMMVAHGRVALRRREGMVPFYANDATNTEHVQRVLGHNKFLVKGFSEGIFVREGYIVTIDIDGKQKRQKVGWGMWPVKMLTEDYFLAEEF